MNNILTNKTFNVETFEIRKAQKQQEEREARQQFRE